MLEDHTPYKSIRSIKDDLFDLNEINQYELSIQIGKADLQACVADKNSGRCLLLDDYILKETDNLDQLIEIITMLLEQHEVLSAGYWKKIRLLIKSNLHTIVPAEHFVPEEAAAFLHTVGKLEGLADEVYYTKHETGDFYSVFSVPAKLVQSMKALYPNKNINVLHQSIPIIEGIFRYNDHTDIKNMFIFADHELLYIMVFDRKDLSFFNSFTYTKPRDFVKFILSVFQSKKMSQQYAKVVVWGDILEHNPKFANLKKFIRKLELGDRPSNLRFRDDFDDLEPQYYYDLYNSFIC